MKYRFNEIRRFSSAKSASAARLAAVDSLGSDCPPRVLRQRVPRLLANSFANTSLEHWTTGTRDPAAARNRSFSGHTWRNGWISRMSSDPKSVEFRVITRRRTLQRSYRRQCSRIVMWRFSFARLDAICDAWIRQRRRAFLRREAQGEIARAKRG